MWDSATGDCLHTLAGSDNEYGFGRCVAFSPDGQLLATATDSAGGVIRVWDPVTGDCLRTLTPDWPWSGTNWGVTFSPDGQLAATADGGTDDVSQREYGPSQR